MDKKITALVAAVVAVVIIAAAAWALNPGGDDGKDEGSDTVVVTDMTGEEVEVTLPVERVAITSSSLLDMFIIIAGEDWADYVCMMPSDLQTREPAKYDLLMETYPQLADVPTSPDLYSSGSFPDETIAVTEPDLVLLEYPTMQWLQYDESNYPILTSMGVSVLQLDMYTDPFAEGAIDTNMNALGAALGQQDRADEIIAFWYEQFDLVESILDSVPESEKTLVAYTEIMGSGQISSSAYGTTGTMGFSELTFVGVTNSSDQATETYSYERLLSIDPDYIIIAVSSYYQQGDAGYALGYGVTSTEAAQQVVEEYKSRPGWSNLTAVQNDNIILYYPELGFTPAAFEKVLYLAEFLYPEYCGDLDADAIMDEYFDRFLPFDVTGLGITRRPDHEVLRWSLPLPGHSEEEEDGPCGLDPGDRAGLLRGRIPGSYEVRPGGGHPGHF